MLLPPINFIFKLLQQHSTVQIWLYEQVRLSLREFLPRVSSRKANSRCDGTARHPYRRKDSRVRRVHELGGQSYARSPPKLGRCSHVEQIDDAVEVKQITKTNDKETRRNLGTRLLLDLAHWTCN